MWTLLWVVPSTSWEWSSCNFMLPPTEEKQGLLYLLAGRQEVPMEYSPRFLQPVTVCHPWFAHVCWHKHFSTLQWCLGPESQSVVTSGFQKHLIIFLCKGEVFPMPARGILFCLEMKSAIFFLQVFPWNMSYKKPGPATHPEVLVRPLPWTQDSWWSRFRHSVHQREYCTRKYQETKGSKYLHSCVLTPRINSTRLHLRP